MNSHLDQERYDVSEKELGELAPEFTKSLYSEESKTISFYDAVLTKGMDFRRRATVPAGFSLTKNGSSGDTVETNRPDKKYNYFYPASNDQLFDPIKLYMTAEANYNTLMQGGTLPLSSGSGFNKQVRRKARR